MQRTTSGTTVSQNHQPFIAPALTQEAGRELVSNLRGLATLGLSANSSYRPPSLSISLLASNGTHTHRLSTLQQLTSNCPPVVREACDHSGAAAPSEPDSAPYSVLAQSHSGPESTPGGQLEALALKHRIARERHARAASQRDADISALASAFEKYAGVGPKSSPSPLPPLSYSAALQQGAVHTQREGAPRASSLLGLTHVGRAPPAWAAAAAVKPTALESLRGPHLLGGGAKVVSHSRAVTVSSAAGTGGLWSTFSASIAADSPAAAAAATSFRKPAPSVDSSPRVLQPHERGTTPRPGSTSGAAFAPQPPAFSLHARAAAALSRATEAAARERVTAEVPAARVSRTKASARAPAAAGDETEDEESMYIPGRRPSVRAAPPDSEMIELSDDDEEDVAEATAAAARAVSSVRRTPTPMMSANVEQASVVLLDDSDDEGDSRARPAASANFAELVKAAAAAAAAANASAAAKFTSSLRSSSSAGGRTAALGEQAKLLADVLRFRDLTEEEITLWHDAVHNDAADEDEELAFAFNIRLHRRDLRVLRSRTWLKDEVLNFYLNLIEARHARHVADRDAEIEECVNRGTTPPEPLLGIKVWNTFFWSKLTEDARENGQLLEQGYYYKGVERWTKQLNIFALDRVLVPLNFGNMHWALACLHIQRRRVVVLDSMGGSSDRVAQVLLRYVRDEYNHKQPRGFDLRVNEWSLERIPVPQQKNGTDCGVFMAMFADYLAAGFNPDFSQDSMDLFRKRIAVACLLKYLP